MKHRKRRFIRVGIAVLSLAILMASAILVAEAMLNRPAVLKKINAAVVKQIGGRISFRSLDLSILLSPHVTISDFRGYIPGKFGGTAKTIEVYPALLPLLTGNIAIKSFTVVSPDIYIESPASDSPQKPDTAKTLSPKQAVAAAVGGIRERLPELEVIIKDGRLTVAGLTATPLVFQHIESRLSVPDGVFRLQSETEFCDRFRTSVFIDPENATFNGKIQFLNLDVPAAMAAAGRSLPAVPKKGVIDFHLDFSGQGQRIHRINARSTAEEIDLRIGDRRLALGGLELAGSYVTSANDHSIRLTTLRAQFPGIDALAEMNWKQIPGKPATDYSISAKAKKADLDSVRQALTDTVGDNAVVRQVLDIVRGGAASDVTFAVAGVSPGELAAFSNMLIEGNVKDVPIHIAGIGLSLDQCAGNVLIREGTLHVSDATARIDKTTGKNGTLLLDLIGEKKSFGLDVDISADLSALPAVLTGILPDKADKWFEPLEFVSGNAEGKLLIGDHLDNLNVSVDVHRVKGNAKLKKFPFEIAVRQAKVMVQGDTIGITDATANVGKSSIKGLSARIVLGSGDLGIRGESAVVDTGEIYPWLLTSGAAGGIGAVVAGLTGTLNFPEIVLTGPITKPGEWNVRLSAATKTLSIITPLLPEPVAFSTDRITVADNTIDIGDTRIRMMDADVRLSGSMAGGASGLERAAAKISGAVGKKAFLGFAEHVHIPEQFIFQPPIRIAESEMSWEKEKQVLIALNMQPANGPNLTVDAEIVPQGFHLRRLNIRDQDSDADIRFRYQDMNIELGFKGKLYKSTVDRLMTENTLLLGHIYGDADIGFPLDDPGGLTLVGHLQAKELNLPGPNDQPIQIAELVLKQEEDLVAIESLSMELLGSQFEAKGKAKTTPEAFGLDLTVRSTTIDAKQIAEAFRPDPDSESSQHRSRPKRKRRTILGSVDVSAGEMHYGRLRWAPVAAAISITEESLQITLTEATICGIAHPGTILFADEQLDMQVRPRAVNADLNASMNCLVTKPVRVTGRYNLSGNVTAVGKRGELAQSLAGNLQFESTGGTIYQLGVLEDIFALLNFTELFRGNLPELRKEGMRYDIVTGKFHFGEGKVHLDEGRVEGPLMKLAIQGNASIVDESLNFTVMVVPLKSIINFASKIPVVRRIFSGHLVSIPVKVGGTVKKPKVTPLAPEAVAKNLGNWVKDLFQAPVDIIQPIIPPEQLEKGEPPVDHGAAGEQ